ncbi:prenyltransferase/squalene oxidase repeat-containing protein [Rhizomonospora bruguierae]|uniref:prenyltransferase/squalene oxidase repeat-containing protein n=1 Tax=Rhizomonospora bruguierae TaxID=1581705 RepID=UPI001BCD3779|nr:prenyltransferase/squalene oxidase repeat-containing protein [Micromonospora sp. NBRC 107566]
MVDLDAAIGFVVAKGDGVDRARLSYLRTSASASAEALAKAEMGTAPDGGWPAFWGGEIASIDATCFHLAELDDLGALARPPAVGALDWLAGRQHEDGHWEEDESLAKVAPPWARPGDPEAAMYLTAGAAFWLTVAAHDARPGATSRYAEQLTAAARCLVQALKPDGTWDSYLATGWLTAAVLHDQEMFYESARIQVALGERVRDMSPANLAAMAAALRRVGVSADDWLLTAARTRLGETQRSDGGWPSDDGAAFDVHTTLTAIRAIR